MSFDWDTATNDARELWIGENIMGWRLDVWGGIEGWRDGDKWKGGTAAFRFTTDAAADYRVLKRVRGTFDAGQFRRFIAALRSLQYGRMRAFMDSRGWGVYPDGSQTAPLYEPGDWATAAYLALQETER